MGLLKDIQMSLLDDKAKIGPILLKLRYLADRLGSHPLEDWVRYEAEGYPNSDTVPEYRMSGLTFNGTLTNGYRTLNNISIPPYLVGKHAGKEWTSYGIKDALPVIEAMLERSQDTGNFGIDASNLKLMLEGKIYQDYTLLEISAKLDVGAFVRIGTAVRAKLLDFTLQLERDVPVSMLIAVGGRAEVTAVDTEKVTHITHNVFNAPVQQITNSGAASHINTTVIQGDVASLEKALAALGLAPNDAQELAHIAAEEKPEGAGKKFGTRVAEWIGKRLSAGADGVMKIGGKVLEDDIANAIQGYYDQLPPLG